ncbi:Suppressor of Sensor Kinase (SLN1), partial [Coemansia erecta]
KIGIAGKMAPGDTGTAVTDAILDRYARRRHRQNFRSSQNSNQAFSTKDNDSDDQSDDGDGDDFGDASSDFAALRPSLDPTNRRLRRSTGAAQGESAAKRADHDDSNGPPARVYELTRAHNPLIQKEWTLLKHGIVRLLDALTQIPDMIRVLHLTVHEREYSEKISTEPTCRGAGCDLLNLAQESFSFASNTASRGSRFLDLMAERKVRTAIARMCVSWCGFIAEDCQAGENSTFRWAVQALESTMKLSRHSSTLEVLPRNDWEEIKSHVAGCVTLMISHFDVLGARTAASKHQQHQKQSPGIQMNDPNALLSLDGIGANFRTHLMQRQRVQHAQQADELRDNFLASDGRIGRVLEVTARPEDRTLRLLAASSSNITLRWQIGRYIGGGAFGAVYVGYNLDSGELMAVKEIRLPSRGLGQDSVSDSGAKIVREMEVMSMLQHPNIVTYYGIEVHREKVYLFMELCTRGSLAQLIRDQGRLDEDTVKEYVVQILRGLQYLHGAGICHRDIKCDNTLLDESMCVKLVDFGAAKVLNNHSMAATRRSRIAPEGPAGAAASLTGTPMYMAPEIILGSNGGSTAGGPKSTEMMRPGRLGAMDIWSLGCCIVEMVSGSPPWAHLDNEWAVMYNVVSGNPPLPDPSTISQKGMHFLRRCFTRQPADRPTASELLDDEWIADTIRMLDRREERAQDASNRTGSAGLNGDGDAETEGLLASNIDAISNATPLEEPAARRSINSLGSSGSQTNLLHPRSRTSSINRKNFSGDLRFTPSSTGADAEVLLSMMDHSVESGGSGSIILSSIGDRSPGTLGHHHGTGGTGVRSAMTYVHSPLVRTPGSPHSVHSAHGAAAAAWPFNKDTNSTGMSTAPAVLAEGDQKQAAENVVNIAMSNNSSNSGAALALFSENVATSEELAAIYSHPSVIYQALNDTSADMGSPVGVGGVAQFAVPNAGTVLASSPDALSPTSPPPPSLPQQQKQQRQQPQQEQQHEQHQQLSNDEIHDLSETTRKALSAMLNLPLEGADVAGVSGWLGEGNTPMEMLEAAEVKETVATTSQLVMRQREQQLRQQQDLRQAVHRQHFRNVILRQKISASSSDTQLAQHPHRQQVVADDKLGPLSDSGVETTLAESDVVAGEFENDGEEYPAQQVSEPPALYPLPPSDED